VFFTPLQPGLFPFGTISPSSLHPTPPFSQRIKYTLPAGSSVLFSSPSTPPPIPRQPNKDIKKTLLNCSLPTHHFPAPPLHVTPTCLKQNIPSKDSDCPPASPPGISFFLPEYLSFSLEGQGRVSLLFSEEVTLRVCTSVWLFSLRFFLSSLRFPQCSEWMLFFQRLAFSPTNCLPSGGGFVQYNARTYFQLFFFFPVSSLFFYDPYYILYDLYFFSSIHTFSAPPKHTRPRDPSIPVPHSPPSPVPAPPPMRLKVLPGGALFTSEPFSLFPPPFPPFCLLCEPGVPPFPGDSWRLPIFSLAWGYLVFAPPACFLFFPPFFFSDSTSLSCLFPVPICNFFSLVVC